MADVDLGPQLDPNDRVRFVDSHRPALDAGRYKVKVTQRLQVDGKEELKATRALEFIVAGPRFVLAPGEVASMFPPSGATGAFGTVLPHVLLRRASLPWERSAVADKKVGEPPWLALLVLAEDEFSATTVAASTLLAGAATVAGAPQFELLTAVPGDDPTQQVTVIDLDAALAKKLLPQGGDLAMLTGVREINDAEGRALVVASRLPVEDKRNIVHLVSIEHRYRLVMQPNGQSVLDAVLPASGRVRFVSLAQWSFRCESGARGDLGALLTQLKIGSVRLAAPTQNLSPVTGPVEAGAVPIEHRLADGRRSAAWYHGPLIERTSGAKLKLPARRAEDLLLFEKASGMTDVSYAAAWTLGRLLALSDPTVGVPLHKWKRQAAHAAIARAAAAAAPGLTAPVADPPFTLTPWFENALARLAAVPFAYLVAEPRQLPPETVCAFALDPLWIEALCDGGFSIGRTSTRELNADGGRRAALMPKPGGRSGMLLRSAAVAGWPDLVVEGRGAKQDRLATLRFERLAPDTLLVLFDGIVRSTTVHPHPQALHFGFDGTRAAPTKRGTPAPWRDSAVGTIDFSRLGTLIGATAPHDFASAMLEGVPRATYQVGVPDV
jgi:hypothetical protein